MRSSKTVAALILTAGLACIPGCLSLGGRTTYVQEDQQTQTRIESLESRVETLEQVLPATHSEISDQFMPPGSVVPEEPY